MLLCTQSSTGYTVVDTGNDYYVPADRNGEAIEDGALKADNDDKIQLKEF